MSDAFKSGGLVDSECRYADVRQFVFWDDVYIAARVFEGWGKLSTGEVEVVGREDV